jgi:protein-S-isoprenylcysteine O-methyltransferase Ste14
MGQPATGSLVAKQISQVVIFCANVLGVATLLNLGRSFGILIAFRELKSYGLYGRVRHPMYATDILLRIGFLINHFNLFTVLVFIISTGCYVYRAILEERFLSQQPEYREYMNRVRYRFIPFVL